MKYNIPSLLNTQNKYSSNRIIEIKDTNHKEETNQIIPTQDKEYTIIKFYL